MATKTLEETAAEYVEHLKAVGKAENTVASYRGDLHMAIEHFGADKEVGKFLPAHVAGFLDSDRVNKTQAGKAKTPVTVAKTKRAFRQFLDWCAEKKYVAESPVPASEAAHRRGTKDAKPSSKKKGAAKMADKA